MLSIQNIMDVFEGEESGVTKEKVFFQNQKINKNSSVIIENDYIGGAIITLQSLRVVLFVFWRYLQVYASIFQEMHSDPL